MIQKIKYFSNEETIALSNVKPFIINTIDGLNGLESTHVKSKGFMQDGEVFNGSLFNTREITINFKIVCNNTDEFNYCRYILNKVFNPKNEGCLYYSYSSINRKIKCIPKETPLIKIKSNRLDADCLITLIAYDPFLEDIDEQKISITKWNPLFTFPLTPSEDNKVKFGVKEQSVLTTIFNKGDVDTGIRIEFIALANLNFISVIDVNTNEFIRVNKPLAEGEKVIINTSYGNKKVESSYNGVITNIMGYLDLNSTFIQLKPGYNIIKYEADKTNLVEVNIYYTSKYLGV